MSRVSLLAAVMLALLALGCGDGVPPESPAAAVEPTEAATSVPAQSLPTGRCAVIVKQVHRLADIKPELATVLGAPFHREPYRLEMEQREGFGIGTTVSVFGVNWGPSVHVVEIGPDGTREAYTNGNRPRPNQSMTAGFREAGTHVIEVSSASNECAATLVFEVAGPEA